MVAVLHFVKDEEGLQKILSVLKDRLAPGSYIDISHYSEEGVPNETIAQLNRLAAGASSQSVSRTCAETSRLFDGFGLVAPGVVNTPLWHPDSPEDLLVDQPARSMAFAGVSRKSK
jgi:hypothetical protein